MNTHRAPPGTLDLSSRTDWEAIFRRSAPLEVEIGAGAGGFALGYAAKHPDRDLVAIEIRRSLAASIREKAEQRGLGNLYVVCADAKAVLPRLFAPRSVQRFHIQFPDPWWKKKHHVRRLVEDDFAILLYNLLRPEGSLELRTDVEQRGVEMAEVLEAVGFVNRYGAGGLAPALPDDVPSSRERGYLERGQPVYRYRFARSDAPPQAPSREPPPSLVGPAQRRR